MNFQAKQAFLFALGKLPQAKTIVVNIGVNSLVHDTGLFNIRTFKNFIKDITELINSRPDRHVVIVISDYLEKSQPKYLTDMPSKNSGLYSALVTLIQNDLVNLFSDGFSEYSLRAIGLSAENETHTDANKLIKNLESIAFSQSKDADAKLAAIKELLNTKKEKAPQPQLRKIIDTLRGLFRHFPRTIPIVMEDIAHPGQHADEEFAAQIAVQLNADVLVAISKKGMLFQTDPKRRIGTPIRAYDTGQPSSFDEARIHDLSKKLNAAAIVTSGVKHIPMLLCANSQPFAITNMFNDPNENENFTIFINSQSQDLPIESRYTAGSVVIDKNAARALVDEKGSLLLAGVVKVEGDFDARSVVQILDESNAEIGKGVINFASAEINNDEINSNGGAEIISREKMRLYI